ncbi:hypothetical protein AA0X95_09530 [Bacillus sp. 1P10SD]|uniref:hypothetical protein n=1 Tax=Bacillus sp. 1P10SD TaxID=3132265 RepID=UPI0039A74932
MEKRDPNNQYSFEFDEKGSNEVSQQIMNSYNSGYIGEGAEVAVQGDFNAAIASADSDGYTES